jgi:hypothetical protein
MYLNFKPHLLPSYVNDTSRWVTAPPAMGVGLSDSIMEENYYLGEVQRWDTDIFKVKTQANYSFNLFDVVDNNLVAGLEGWNSNYFVAYGTNTLYAWQDSDSKKWPNTETYRASFYAQDQALLFDEMLKLTAGFRVNKEKYMNLNVTPRFSASLEPIKNTVIKFNYSEGFRSLAFDQFAQAVGEVDPTKMRQLEYGISNRLTAGPFEALSNVTYYTMRKLGNYVRKDNDLGVSWSIAEDSTEISGVEGQIKWSTSAVPEHKISGYIGANNVMRDLTPTSDKNDGDKEFYNEYPEYTGKFGISDQYKWISLGASVDYSSALYYEVAQYNTVTGASGDKVLMQQDPYTVLNLTLGVGPFDFMDDINAKLTLQVNNATDVEYNQVIRRWGPNPGMLQPPRNYLARIDFMF